MSTMDPQRKKTCITVLRITCPHVHDFHMEFVVKETYLVQDGPLSVVSSVTTAVIGIISPQKPIDVRPFIGVVNSHPGTSPKANQFFFPWLFK